MSLLSFAMGATVAAVAAALLSNRRKLRDGGGDIGSGSAASRHRGRQEARFADAWPEGAPTSVGRTDDLLAPDAESPSSTRLSSSPASQPVSTGL